MGSYVTPARSGVVAPCRWPRPPVEQDSIEHDLAVIHSRLKASDFARLSTEGQIMTVDEAVALALEE